jgi:hypothetical protein
MRLVKRQNSRAAVHLFPSSLVSSTGLFSFLCTYLTLSFLVSPSKPLMSSGSCLTLHICETYYLSAINNDLMTTGLIFIGVNIYSGPGWGEGGLTATFYTHLFYQGNYYLPTVLLIIGEVTICSGAWVRGLKANFSTHLFYQGHCLPCGHYLPCKAYCLVLPCIKAVIHSRPLSFCHDITNI